MAAGRPILLFGPSPSHATDIIGEHDIGWHVAHGNVDGAVEALRDIRCASSERLERMGRFAQELVRRHYSRDVLLNRFCDEVEAVL
jgi:glycosyltransferase involved in cell wall biosynthesis